MGLIRPFTPTPPLAVALPRALDTLSQSLDAYPLRDLLQPCLMALAAQPTPLAGAPAIAWQNERVRIHHWTDFCLSRWAQQIEQQLEQFPKSGNANLGRAKARLQSEHQALCSVRTELQRLQCRHGPSIAGSSDTQDAPLRRPSPPQHLSLMA